AIVGLAAYGTAKQPPSGQSVPELSHHVTGVAVGATLFATLFGALLVTSEYRRGTFARTALITRRRADILLAKAVVGTALGAVIGLTGVIAAVATGMSIMAQSGLGMVLDRHTWSCAAGTVVAAALGGAWGVALGSLIRNQLAAVGT